MNRAVLSIVVALAANVLFAGWEDWQHSLYSASFDEYAEDEALDSMKGATGGEWGEVPSGATAVAQKYDSVHQYMACRTVGDEGVFFTPYDSGSRTLKTVTTRIRLSAYDGDPKIPVGARAAFAYSVENDVATFVGLVTTTGSAHWEKLYGSVTPGAGWYDVSMKFVEKEGVTRVQYRLMNGKGEYEPLHDATGASWFEAVGTPGRVVAGKVEYRGDGGVQYLTGGEPRRGLLIGLVPWHTLLIDETVYNHGTGTWAVYDSESGGWQTTPTVVDDAYFINVADGTAGNAFIPKDTQSDALKAVEFSVRFSAPNDVDTVPSDVSALVRVVEEPLVDLSQVAPTNRFACLIDGGWYTNMTFVADLDTDYMVKIVQDDKEGTVSYLLRHGRGNEGRPYEYLLKDAHMPVYSPFYAFFGGHGFVYEIKSSASSDNK